MSDPSLDDDLEELRRKAGLLAQASIRPSTRRAYETDYAHFCEWCETKRRAPMPATPDTVSLYLTHCMEKSALPTLERRLAAIRSEHRAQGQPIPESAELMDVWSGIRETMKGGSDPKEPLPLDQLTVLLDQLPEGIRSVRDRALLLVGFGAALRRSELVALQIGFEAKPLKERPPARLSLRHQGIEIQLHGTKGGRRGEGEIIRIPRGATPETCAVRALQAWLDATGIQEGHVFRRIDRWGKVGSQGLTGQSVALIVKAATARLGWETQDFAGHSLRSGLATSAALGDAPAELLMAHMRHKKFETTMGYIRGAQGYKRNAAKFAGM